MYHALELRSHDEIVAKMLGPYRARNACDRTIDAWKDVSSDREVDVQDHACEWSMQLSEAMPLGPLL